MRCDAIGSVFCAPREVMPCHAMALALALALGTMALPGHGHGHVHASQPSHPLG